MLNLKSQVEDARKYGARAYGVDGKWFATTEKLVLSLAGYISVRSDKFATAEEAFDDLNKKVAQLKEREEQMIANPLELMKHLCERHDWFYRFSDDGRAHNAGHSNEMLMRRIVKECGDPAIAIWNQHAPNDQCKY